MKDKLAALKEKKKELELRLIKIRQDLARPLSQDFEEQATELENRDVLLEIQRVSESELQNIKQEIANYE